ncbi:ArsR/SmtB family transcription factor [Georgenia muralis]|uniref:ArsR family transcriptional regulator n=1 Tax=Georgenia muralis TaxID=154117 RepID=A0A3N5A4K3_9MICO|nr:metalloregulator ArsR/SmtB family transcription factor [Georgenia muralis]RPF28295.1 ArsR family transcriptional regulator [Georgenia muralis]
MQASYPDISAERGAVDAAALAPAAAMFHGLSDPARLAILQHLTVGEHRVRDLTEHLGLAQSTVSAHLACLRDCGLVTSRPEGRASMFSLTTAPELLAVLAAAEQLLASTGYAVELCPNYGVGATTTPDVEHLKSHEKSESA